MQLCQPRRSRTPSVPLPLQAKGVHLEPATWTSDDLLTPSYKLKRADAKKKYQGVIDAQYVALGDTVAGLNIRHH